MGLLTLRTGRWAGRALLLAALTIGPGCDSLRVGQRLLPAASGVSAPAPPLEEVWRYNGEAAFGPSAALVTQDHLILTNRIGEIHVVELEEGDRVGKVEVGASIEGAPVLLDGRYLVVPVEDGRYGLLSYDLEDGSRAWGLRDAPHLAGVLHVGGTIVAAAYDGTIRGLEPYTGTEQWTLRPDSTSSFFASPVPAASGLVVLADDRGGVTALDPANGQVRWTRRLDGPVQETPAVLGDLIVVPTTRGHLVALEAATGRVRWTLPGETPTTRFATPAVSDGRLVVGASDGILRRLDPATGGLLWATTFDGNIAAAPLLSGAFAYAGTLDRKLAALDLESGAVVWETELPGRIKSVPVMAEGLLIVLAEPKDAHAFRAAGAVAAHTDSAP